MLSLACDLTKARVLAQRARIELFQELGRNHSRDVWHRPSPARVVGRRPLGRPSRRFHTKGMAQFGAPEICLSKQPNADPRMLDTLFHVAQTVLTLPHSIPDGKTMDSPQGRLKIEQSGVPGRRNLIHGTRPLRMNHR
jgi:hypothetical protein